MQQSLLGALPCAHIRLGAGHPIGLACLIPYGNPPGEHPPIIPVLMEHTVLIFKMRTESFEVRVDLDLYLLHIQWMNAVEPLIDVSVDLLSQSPRSSFQREEKWASFVMRSQSHSPSFAAIEAKA